MPNEFFQCLVCNSFFGNLWKVEKHIKQHDNNERIGGERMENAQVPLRRGMLPIKKVNFLDCFIPVVKNQIDPTFLEQYSSVEAKEEPQIVQENVTVSDFLSLEYDDYDDVMSRDDSGEMAVFDTTLKASCDTKVKGRRGRKKKLPPPPPFVETEERKPRKSQLKAVANIRRATAAVLKIPDQSDISDEEKEELEYIQDLLEKLSDEGEDDDFKPPSYINKNNANRKVGRPFGSLKKSKVARQVNNKVFGTSKKRKIKKPTDESKFECKYCSESFSVRTELNMHLYINHQEQAKMLTCPISSCDRPFPNFFSLRSHLKVHTDAERKELALLERPDSMNAQKDSVNHTAWFTCKFCLEKFKSFPLLQKHIVLNHSDSSMLKCPCCDKCMSGEGVIRFISHLKGFHPKFIDPHDQRAQERDVYRQKEKRFKCDKCSATFHFENQRKKHLEFHDRLDKKNKEEENDASRRFTCPVCNKKFKYKDNLRRHFTLHLENNPYVCNFPGCNKKFNSDYNLRRHKSLHVESSAMAQRIHCPLCDQSFSRKDKLPKHLREIHKPSDINNVDLATAVTRRKYQSRLPHCGRVPKYLTYKDLSQDNKDDSLNTSTNNESEENREVKAKVVQSVEKRKVKVEAVESAATEEIHLVDRILLDSDGHATHIKGEWLSPEKVSRNVISQTREPYPEKFNSSSTIAQTDVSATYTTSLTKLITSDPVFEKLSKEDPSKVKDMVTANYNYRLKRMFDCQICEAVFSRAWTLQLHLKTQHNQTIMDQTQPTTGSSDETEVANQQPITLMCGTCAYPASDVKELAKHVKQSHEPKVRCKCGLYFDSQRRLSIHIRDIHDGERNYKCKFCSKKFTNRQYVRSHERKVHQDSNQPIAMKKCPVPGCDRELAPSYYYRHLKQHDRAATDELQREKKHKCMLCGDLLCNAMALRRHIDAVHLGKPINRRRKDQRLKDATPGTLLRRGPKSVGDEWFQPLLEQIGFRARNEEDQANGISANDRANTEGTVENEEEDELASILGL